MSEAASESFRPQGSLFTFYSFKGGVGRSMCLANVAALLAASGRKVLIVDWDLEAPGIERYFHNSPSRVEDARQVKRGLVELMQALAEGTPMDWRTCLLQAFPFGTQRQLSIMPSGQQDGGYAARVHALNWEKLFRENRLGEALEALREEWLNEYDFVFVDSRTGFTDAGNICTIHLPDVLVLLFTTNDQSLNGVIDVARRARIVRKELPYDRKSLVVIPVPARDETQSQQMEALEWRSRFAKELREFYDDWVPQGKSAEDILEKLRIPYKAFWSFGERLPVAERGVEDHLDVGYAYNILAKLLQAGINWEGVFPSEHSEADEQGRLARLIQAGNAMIEGLSEREVAAVRSLLLRLVFVARPDEGIEDSRRWEREADLGPGEARELARLIDARIVQRDAENRRVQLAEAALVTEWPMLQKWIAESRPGLYLRQDLRKRAGRLLSSDELFQVEALEASGLELGPQELPVVTLSAQRSRKLMFGGWVAAVAGLLIVVSLGWYGFNKWRALVRSRQAAAYAHAAAAMVKDESMAPFAALMRFEATAVEASDPSPPAAWSQLATDMVRLAQRVDGTVTATWQGRETGGFRLEPVSSKPGIVRVIDAATSLTAFQIMHGAAIESAVMSADGEYVRTTGGGRTLVWRGPRYDQLVSIPHASQVWGIDFSRDGKLLAVASANVRIFNVADGTEVRRLNTQGMIRSLAYSPQGDRLATAGWDNAVTVWNTQKWTTVMQWRTSTPQLAVAWSPDGKMLAAGGLDGVVRLYETPAAGRDALTTLRDPLLGKLIPDKAPADAEAVLTLKIQGAVNAVAFSPDGKTVSAGGLDGHVHVWDAKTGEQKGDRAMGMGVTRIIETKDFSAVAGFGGLVLAGSDLETAAMFGAPPSPPLLDLSVFKGEYYGYWIAGAAYPGFPILLEIGAVMSDHNRYPAPRPPAGARSIAFSPDGKLLATGGNDRVVRIWRSQRPIYGDPCIAVPRNLTPQEWNTYVPGESYREFCSNLP